MYLGRTAIPSQRLTSIQGTECDYYYYMNNYFIQYKNHIPICYTAIGTSTSQPHGIEEPLNAEAGISTSQPHGTEEPLNAEAGTSTSQFCGMQEPLIIEDGPSTSQFCSIREPLIVEDVPSTSRGIEEV